MEDARFLRRGSTARRLDINQCSSLSRSGEWKAGYDQQKIALNAGQDTEILVLGLAQLSLLTVYNDVSLTEFSTGKKTRGAGRLSQLGWPRSWLCRSARR